MVGCGTSSTVFHVVVGDIRVIEQQQRVLEVIQYPLFRFAVLYILEKVQVRFIGTPELVVQGMDLADFTQAAVLQDGGGLDSMAIDVDHILLICRNRDVKKGMDSVDLQMRVEFLPIVGGKKTQGTADCDRILLFD
ncbi:unnamed protein product [Porites lobata]|uniref:Uncharacterized protein n=1 Tax=Porites lobata TaxID=104759 RepID=A0ABN8NIW1_9CNID|nr:unnamed protein product [Porites lobata]